MSDTAANLLSGLTGAIIGAIVGGAASLAGSVVVNRLELRRTTRLRLYDELIPLAQESISMFLGSSLAGEEDVAQKLTPIFRIGVILSPRERKLVRMTSHSWTRVHAALSKESDTRVVLMDTRQTTHLLNELSQLLRRKLD